MLDSKPNIKVARVLNRCLDSDQSQFDADCIKQYGEKTCILCQIDESHAADMYQVRVLDKHHDYMVEKSSFYKLIPNLLVGKYTVVIVEKVGLVKDITSVHLPVQVQLSYPPIIQ